MIIIMSGEVMSCCRFAKTSLLWISVLGENSFGRLTKTNARCISKRSMHLEWCSALYFNFTDDLR